MTRYLTRSALAAYEKERALHNLQKKKISQSELYDLCYKLNLYKCEPQECLKILTYIDKIDLLSYQLLCNVQIERAVKNISEKLKYYKGDVDLLEEITELKETLIWEWDEIKEESDRHATQFLWLCKLKSRNSFLCILEFIQIQRKVFKIVVQALNLFGDLFFFKFIANSYQFSKHDFLLGQEILFIKTNPNAEKQHFNFEGYRMARIIEKETIHSRMIPPCIPSRDQLSILTFQQMQNHYLSSIGFCGGVGIYFLTFVWSNGMQSPPNFCYKTDPPRVLLPQRRKLREIYFGLGGNGLSNVNFYGADTGGSKGKPILHCGCSLHDYRSESLYLSKSDKLIGAVISTNLFMATSIQFLVADMDLIVPFKTLNMN